MAIDLTAALDAVMGAFGVAAVYAPPSPPGGDSVAVTVLSRTADADLAISGLRSRSMAGVFEIKASEVTRPLKGGTLTITGPGGATVWKLTDEPEAADPDRLVWTLRCALAS